MALDKQAFEKLAAFINSKWKTKECVLCSANDWTVNGYVVLSSQDSVQGLVLGGQVLANAAVICKNCGNTHLINLVTAGVVPPG
jgi:hypothetical protein